ncbi:MAG: sensor histidine kinase [Bacteroidota bacterium]
MGQDKNDSVTDVQRQLQQLALDNLNDMVVITKATRHDPLNSQIVFVNKSFERITGYKSEEVIGETPTFLHGPKTSAEVLSRINDKIRERKPLREEFINYKKDGTPYWVELDMAPFPTKQEQYEYWVGINRDISDRKQYEHQLKKSLKEKETLLTEVHHRVKNNLAIISGLLQMQVFNTEDDNLLEKLKESQSRIQSIAMVHEKLYSSESFSEIALDQYIDELMDWISASISDVKKDITIEKEIDAVYLTVNQAIPCGLLLNELITNCYKHAFNDQEEGHIRVFVEKSGSEVALSVEDNGSGLRDDFNIDEESSLGMTIINTLTHQLNGTLEIDSDSGGTKFKLIFNIENGY